MASIDSSLAESMKAQVFTTKTSASSACRVISIPRTRTLPSMISASTRFLAQPRLIIPTFVGRKSLLDALFKGDIDIAGSQHGSILLNLDRSPVDNPQDHATATKAERRMRRFQPVVERGRCA